MNDKDKIREEFQDKLSNYSREHVLSEKKFKIMIDLHHQYIFSDECSGRKLVFDGVDLRNIDFSKLDIRYSTFLNCDLRGSTFYGTKMNGIDLEGSDLRGVDLSCTFINTDDLLRVKLDNVRVNHYIFKYEPEIE